MTLSAAAKSIIATIRKAPTTPCRPAVSSSMTFRFLSPSITL
nr:MAG TPA: hypothetical protein [Caudoviricetes sp.]